MIWLDIETTGLDPKNDLILEIAMFNDETGATFQRVMMIPHGTVLTSFIVDMHTKNGLLAECAKSPWHVSTVEDDACAWLQGDRLTLAGSSVHFDLSFLRTYMPRLAARFSHRLFDVSAIKLFCQAMGMTGIPKAEAVHRAIDDIQESIKLYQMCRSWLGR